MIPQEVYAAWDAKEQGARAEADWNKAFDAYRAKHPEQAAEFVRRMNGELPASWAEDAKKIIEGANAARRNRRDAQGVAAGARRARRRAAGTAGRFGRPDRLQPDQLEGIEAGACSRRRERQRCTGIQWGNHINYGVREFGMSAAINGIALHGGYRPFGGTFLTFSDYSRNALRVAALMKSRSIFVFTHDSIGLGEDGPTHQSVEHVSSLRLIPQSADVAPGRYGRNGRGLDARDRAHQGPSALIFTRQNLPFSQRNDVQIANIAKGGYVLRDWNDDIPARKIILIATGSEVELAMEAVDKLAQEGIGARVVSMPSTNVFDRQDAEYRERVLPKGVPRVAIEAGVTDFWRKYVGLEGGVVGIDTFGESAPAGVLFKHFGFTVENVVETAKAVLAGA